MPAAGVDRPLKIKLINMKYTKNGEGYLDGPMLKKAFAAVGSQMEQILGSMDNSSCRKCGAKLSPDLGDLCEREIW